MDYKLEFTYLDCLFSELDYIIMRMSVSVTIILVIAGYVFIQLFGVRIWNIQESMIDWSTNVRNSA